MTVSSPVRSVTYTGDGVATSFPYSFKIYLQDHVVVKLITIATEEVVTLTESQYGITGVGYAGTGGAVTYPLSGPPLANTHKIIIERIVPYKQEQAISNQAGYRPETVERTLDLIVMMIQQIVEGNLIFVDGSIANSKLETSVAARVLGRPLGAGTGFVQYLTGAQLAAILGIDQTLDADKPISDATQAELDALATAILDVSSYTAADVLAKIKTVDGSGSGLDADIIRGTTPTAFALTLLDDANAAAARATLGANNADNVTTGTLIDDVFPSRLVTLENITDCNTWLKKGEARAAATEGATNCPTNDTIYFVSYHGDAGYGRQYARKFDSSATYARLNLNTTWTSWALVLELQSEMDKRFSRRPGFAPNVFDHGADRTGAAATAAAFSSAQGAAPSRGAVRVPGGTYNLDYALGGFNAWFLENPVSLTGAGASAGLPGPVTMIANVTGSADPFYSGPWNHDWVKSTAWAAISSAGTSPLYTSRGMFLSTFGNAGFAAGSRSSDAPGIGNMGCIGLFPFVVNDADNYAYALYNEAFHLSGARWTVNEEFDTIVKAAVAALNPSDPYATGVAGGIWGASGGYSSGVLDASFCYAVINNGARFHTALFVANNSIVAGGEVIALSSEADHRLVSAYNAIGERTGDIVFTGDSPLYGSRLLFGDYGLFVQHITTGKSLLQVFGHNTHVNGLLLRGAEAGAPVELRAQGDSTNVSMMLTPKGAASVLLGLAAPTSPATHPGRVIIPGGSLASNTGLEFHAANYGSGYGWKVNAPDLGNSEMPLIFGARTGNAAWTEIMRIKNGGGMIGPKLSAAPSNPNEGEEYFDTGTKKKRVWTGSAWADLH